MTQPNSSGALALPPPNTNRPMVLRMITDGLLPPTPPAPAPPGGTIALWAVNEIHPLMANLRVKRMIDQGNGIDVYSVSDDGTIFMRHFIPAARIRITEEIMSAQLFVAELEDAEADEDDDPEVDPEEPEERPALPANGQATS